MPQQLMRDERNRPVLLLIHDQPDKLQAREAALVQGDWQLRVFPCADSVLECLQAEQVTLVLLELAAADADPGAWVRRIRCHPQGRQTPIIVLYGPDQPCRPGWQGLERAGVEVMPLLTDPDALRQRIGMRLEQARNSRELLQLNRQLDDALALNTSLLQHATEGVLLIGEDGRIRFANPAMAKMLGSAPDELAGQALLPLLRSPEAAESWPASPFYQCWQRQQVYRLEQASLCAADGSSVPVSLTCSPLPAPQQGLLLLAQDMSLVRDLHTQLESLAVTDALTGLLNRRGFHKALDAALARTKRSGRKLAVLCLDLDDFKRINDSLGHGVGDQLLRRVGAQLKGCLRPYDSLARVGGDEFIMVLDSLPHIEDAARVAEKLIEQVSVRHSLNGVEFTVGAGIGIACYPDCGQTVEGLLRAADMAMYEAKRAGPRQYRFFSPQMNGRARSRLLLEESLRTAIDENAFSLVYQPQIHLDSGKLRGFEALLRWQHQAAGNVPPGVFIPLLEETQLINRLGEWIFDQGARQQALFAQQGGSDLVLSLNVSPVQFGRRQLAEELQRVLERYRLAPAQLEVEVTEGALMRDLQASQEQLGQLRRLGVKIAIDDFGTGYSSLAYLRHFELDTLKIDRLFISNMLESSRDAAVVSTIIDLGRNLGLEVIAEGVETLAQREWLVAHGCAIMQGFLVAPGLVAEAAQRFPRQLDWQSLAARPSLVAEAGS